MSRATASHVSLNHCNASLMVHIHRFIPQPPCLAMPLPVYPLFAIELGFDLILHFRNPKAVIGFHPLQLVAYVAGNLLIVLPLLLQGLIVQVADAVDPLDARLEFQSVVFVVLDRVVVVPVLFAVRLHLANRAAGC